MDYLKAILVLSLFHISTVYCIQCFVCNSLNDSGCDTLQKNDTNSRFVKTCEPRDGQESFCRKTMFTILGDNEMTRYSRSCGWIFYKGQNDSCIKYVTDYKDERSCQCFSDFCNKSDVFQPNILSTFITLSITVAVSKLFI